jgi:hypothetical protein
MAKSRRDDDDDEDRPRRRRRPRDEDDEDEDEEERPARRSKSSRRRDEEDDDDDDDRPRRSRDSALSTIIPYRNGMALAAYYCGFGGLISVLGGFALGVFLSKNGSSPKLAFLLISCGLGGILAILSIILGILGLNYASNHRKAKGTGHAWTGVALGTLEVLGLVVLIIVRSDMLRGN